ncbi:MAG: hypothetical protein IKA64_06560 [Clostridia bacterium]|nr:hypothetical protein [Clostridia bacterium]
MTKEFSVDFALRPSKLGVVSGVEGAPIDTLHDGWDFSAELSRMNTPLVRLSPSRRRPYLRLCSIFPSVSLDPTLPESYDFSLADGYILSAAGSGAKLLLSLGECDKRYLDEPEKWAEACIGIIAHYNEGFADGYKLGIKYCELFAHEGGALKEGVTPEAHAELYRTVARALKERFPRLKLGGYSAGGFRALNHIDASEDERRQLEYLDAYLSALRAPERAPLDFLSWCCHADEPEEITVHANYARSYLAQHGYKRTESIITSLSLGAAALERRYPAYLASALVIAESSSADTVISASILPYSADNALFTLDDCSEHHPYAAYEVMTSFGELYRLGRRASSSQDFRREVYLLAAADKAGAGLLLVSRDFSGTVRVELKNAPSDKCKIKGIIGGGKRGAGYLTEREGIPLGQGALTLKVGKNEVYFITLL